MANSNGVNPTSTQQVNFDPAVGSKHTSGTSMQIADDLNQLLEMLPEEIRQPIDAHPQRNELIEIVMDLGRLPEARFPHTADYLCERPVTIDDLNYCIQRVGSFSGDNRAGIEQTLHRISAIRNRQGSIIGLTCRVGRAVYGTISMIRDLVESGQSILMLGRPGVGKTTALREIARVLADDFNKRVVIVDTSNEIAGDGDIPHPAIGRARRMQVARPELQHQVMIEAVENHMPEVIVIDEIGTELEALAARTIAERGVQLIGTAHGNQLANLVKNPTLSDLIGGIQSVTLSDEEARRRGAQKTVLERESPPTFDIAVEMIERQRWVVHENVADTVDSMLRGRQPSPQVRTIGETGKVKITHELPSASTLSNAPAPAESTGGLRASGRMQPLPRSSAAETVSDQQYFEQMLDASLSRSGMVRGTPVERADRGLIPAEAIGEDVPLRVYPYAVSRHQLDRAVEVLDLPITLTKDLDSADAVLALRSHVKNHSKLRRIAKARQVPIYTVKSSTVAQIARALRRLLNIDDPGTPEVADMRLFSPNGNEDEIEALEEARLAVEQIVLPKGQPVELLPRSPKVRKMQHELVEHYRLQSSSFGDEPNRRLRIYPA